MTGAATLGILSALAYAVSNVALFRGSRTSPMKVAVLLSVFSGVPFYLLVAAAFGQLRAVPLPAVGLFAAAGLTHFVVGRSLLYAAISLMGAARATVFTSLAPVFALVLAVALLGESMAALAVVGACLAIAGPLLAGRRTSTADRTLASPSARGIATALLAALFGGFSPILVKAALDRVDAATMGTLISYTSAACVLAVRAAVTDGLQPFRDLDRRSLRWFALAALFANLAQLFRYLALGEGDVTLVVVLMQLTPVFVAALSVVASKEEQVGRGVALGSILGVAGVGLVVTAG